MIKAEYFLYRKRLELAMEGIRRANTDARMEQIEHEFHVWEKSHFPSEPKTEGLRNVKKTK